VPGRVDVAAGEDLVDRVPAARPHAAGGQLDDPDTQVQHDQRDDERHERTRRARAERHENEEGQHPLGDRAALAEVDQRADRAEPPVVAAP
jgi:hypothetical protein